MLVKDCGVKRIVCEYHYHDEADSIKMLDEAEVKVEHLNKEREYLAEDGVIGRLDIINTNDAALRFWNSIFELQPVRNDDVQTEYGVAGVKDETDDGERNHD